MPLTLSRQSYLSIMAQKGVDATVAATNYDRMAAFSERFRATRGGENVRMFGAVDVGRESYWWDYGQLKLYFANNKLATASTDEAASLRRFLGLADGERVRLSNLGTATVDGESCVIHCTTKTGSVVRSCLSNVGAQHLEVEDSLLVNVSAKRISAHGALLYNVVDESEEGVTLGPGERARRRAAERRTDRAAMRHSTRRAGVVESQSGEEQHDVRGGMEGQQDPGLCCCDPGGSRCTCVGPGQVLNLSAGCALDYTALCYYATASRL